MPPHVPATDEQTPTTKEWAFLAGNGGSWVRMVVMAWMGGRVVVRVRSAPRFATTAAGPLLRRDVHFALENDGWNCAFECEVHVSAPGGVRRCLRPPRGAPPRGTRRRRLSKSVAKARIEPGPARRIVDIPRFFSPPIPSRGAFAADLDTPRPRNAPGAPPAPSRARPPASPRRSGPAGHRSR